MHAVAEMHAAVMHAAEEASRANVRRSTNTNQQRPLFVGLLHKRFALLSVDAHARITCTGHMHGSHARVTCTGHMYGSHARVTCTGHMHWSHARVTCLLDEYMYTYMRRRPAIWAEWI